MVREDEMPAVVSTNPSDGETGVRRNLEWISLTFSKEMEESFSVSTYCDPPSANGWSLSPHTAATWSRDRRTFHFSRDNVGKRLDRGVEIHVILNPTVHPSEFKDVSGNAVDRYVFTFTIRQAKPQNKKASKGRG
jgi:hypothetical protein